MTDLDPLAEELNSVAIHLVRRLRRSDDALGITPARLSALSVLVFGGPQSINRLARAEQVTGPTMSRIVAALVEAGLVAREPDPDDARSARLAATDQGRAAMERGRRMRVSRLAAELGCLPDADRRTLEAAVRILRRMERAEDG
ncbi:MAG TPA: MarR family transcriptional regulator [Candidatus Dormibacteraeota bacterium]|jgi:DNA-binding MarR family transcriptional regulator|nr:MarR family transcriptional regulator [Candidatus Dormibacteraeota bacterium]